MPSGIERSKTNIAAVSTAASPSSLRSRATARGSGRVECGIGNELVVDNSPFTHGNCALRGDYSAIVRELLPMITVMVVDDEPLIRWAVREILEDAGYGVVEAGSASEAMTRIADADGRPVS